MSLTVPPGASLVALTDGLVERRGEDIDEGIARIVNATNESSDATAEELLDRVLATAGGGKIHDDDVTVLVLRRTR